MENEELKKFYAKIQRYGFTTDRGYYVKQISKQVKMRIYFDYNNNKTENKIRSFTIIKENEKTKKQEEISFSLNDGTNVFGEITNSFEAFYYAFIEQEIKQVFKKEFFIPTDRELTEEEKQKIIEICKSQNILNYEDVSKYTNALKEFEEIYNNEQAVEQDWQNFFQKHLWVLGLSLQQQLLIPSRDSKDIKNELYKRNILDGSFISEGKVNYLTICEFKKCKDKKDLLVEEYRKRDGEVVQNCFAPTSELSGGIAQILQYKRNIQKEAEEQKITNKAGNDTGKVFQIVDPKCYLIIGDLKEVENNDGKKRCFELFRRNCKDVEIITYDEIQKKIEYVVNNMKDNNTEQTKTKEETNEINDDDLPF